MKNTDELNNLKQRYIDLCNELRRSEHDNEVLVKENHRLKFALAKYESIIKVIRIVCQNKDKNFPLLSEVNVVDLLNELFGLEEEIND